MSESVRIRRILVALDASPQSLAALEAAVELAASLGSELAGMFVEDVNLIRMAGLPVTSEIGSASGRVRAISERRLSRQLRGQAARAEQALAAVANQAHVVWSFKIARGSIDAELLEAAAEADLIILGRESWSSRGRLGSTARAILSAAPERALIVEQGERLRPTLMVLYDGSARARRALDTGITIARGGGGFLTVGIVAEDEDTARSRQKEIAEILQPYRIEARYRWLLRIGVEELAEMVRTEEECILILPGESPLLKGRKLPEALDEFDCPVLLVQ